MRIGVVGGNSEYSPILGENSLCAIIGGLTGVLRPFIKTAGTVLVGYIILDGILKMLVECTYQQLIGQPGEQLIPEIEVIGPYMLQVGIPQESELFVGVVLDGNQVAKTRPADGLEIGETDVLV
jgi:hypothetical protein